MQTPHQGESVDSAASQVPQKVGAIPGLKTKIMAALAAIGLAASAEKVEGASVVLNGLSPASTISGPAKISGLATSTNQGALFGLENSRLFGWAVTNDVSTDRITLTLSPTDVYGAGGTLTITGTLIASTNTTSDTQGSSVIGGGASYRIGQEVRFGRAGDTPTTLASLDSGPNMFNSGSALLSTTEDWSGTTTFTSAPFNITQSGTYNIDHLFTRDNVSGYAKLQSFSITYSAVPEPSTTLMAGSLFAAALLRRKRPSSSQE